MEHVGGCLVENVIIVTPSFSTAWRRQRPNASRGDRGRFPGPKDAQLMTPSRPRELLHCSVHRSNRISVVRLLLRCSGSVLRNTGELGFFNRLFFVDNQLDTSKVRDSFHWN